MFKYTSPLLPILAVLILSLVGCKTDDQVGDVSSGTSTQVAPPTPTAPAAAPIPYTFEPGIRFGRMDYFTRPEDLNFLYPNKLIKAKIHVGEGQFVDGYRVQSGRETEFEVLLPSEEMGLPTMSIKVFRKGGPWKFAGTNVGVGTPLDALIEANGDHFEFSGWGWDYGGAITNWKGGNLTGLRGSLMFEQEILELDTIPETLYGDHTVSTADDRLFGLGVHLEEIQFTFDDPATIKGSLLKTKDNSIVPGVRLGDIYGGTTVAEFKEKFAGEYEVADFDEPGGLVLKGYRVYPNTANEFLIAFPEENPYEAKELRIQLERADSNWKVAGTNVGVGSTLAEVQLANGKPFELMSYNWENAGEVMDWDGGHLKGTFLFIGDALTADGKRLEYNEEMQILSNDRKLRELMPVVSKIDLYLAE
ncbi:hypothetical protein A3850_010060 [Lewinella sp. 4G2]|nr:hypothetical protein A3850_010060 [Lewinella sp. 4G2]